MDRFGPTDAQWAKMASFCLGKPTDPGRAGGDARLFTEAVLWIARTGRPWRDLPATSGKWSTVLKRFCGWAKADVLQRMSDAVSDEPDMECAMADATIVPVRRHGQGAKGGLSQAIGKPCGGVTAKTLALTDALGRLVGLVLLPAQRHGTIGVAT